MIGAVFRAMCLELLRDRAALLLAFALPGIFFVIFAEIFAASAGGELVVTTATADEARSPLSARLLAALDRSDRLRLERSADAADVAERVRRGDADAGLVLNAPGDGSQMEARVLIDPAHGAAAQLLQGEVRAAWAAVTAPAAAPQRPPGSERGPGEALALVERSVFADRALSEVAYAAGAVSFMFLLFASASGAMSLMDEQESGILDRVLAGPGGIDVLIAGKFFYLLVQGVAQVAVIFVIAWLGYRVPLGAHLAQWLVVTVCAACCAAGLAMLLVTASATRRQAQTVSTLVILVVSAIGGSMVPRYVMPPSFQSVGWLTPNTWALEAYSGIFWREQTLLDVAVPCLILAGSGGLGLAVAVALARRGARR